MINFLIGSVIGIIGGTFLGAYLVTKFDVTNISYAIAKLKAKKGSVIDINQDIEQPGPQKKKKRKLFSKIKIKRRNKA